jgi:hypothetical protein
VAHEPDNLSLHPSREQGGASRRLRRLNVLATTLILGLGVAGPALASDGEELLPPVPVVQDTVTPSTEPVPALPAQPIPLPELELPPVPTLEEPGLEETPLTLTETQTEAGSINVSVRVLSPGTDGPVSQESGASDLVSATHEADITPAADPATVTPPEAPDASAAAGINTNVSVRVLSPGDNGPVSQTNGSAGVDPSDESGAGRSSSADPASSAADATPSSSSEQGSVSEINAPRYHEEDSQYQSDEQSPIEPWNWSWVLALDCTGNATSLSTQTGSQTSSIWAWDWAWKWSCASTDTSVTSPSGSGPDSSSTSDASNTNVSVRVLSPGDNGPVTQSTTSTGTMGGAEASRSTPSNEPWIWTWTFTFCNTTTSHSTQMDSQTPLSWTWDWAWNWTCDSASAAHPDPGDATQAGTDATSVPPLSAVIPAMPAPPVPSSVDVSPLPLPPFLVLPVVPSVEVAVVVPTVDVAVAVIVEPEVTLTSLPELSLPSPAVPGVDVSVVIVAAEPPPPLESEAAPTPEPAHQAPARRETGSSAPHGTAPTVVWQRPQSAPSQPSSQPTTKHKPPSARPASPRRARGPLAPFGQLRSPQGGGLGASGARVPSAPVVAVAAPIAFFMLAAPSLGRRIRVARELSPRSTYRSSIDHPG